MIDRQTLKELLHYDEKSGVFTWKDRSRDKFRKKNSYSSWKTRFAGQKAGCATNEGYVYIGINGKLYAAHRLAFLYVYGYLPPLIDHIDRNKNNNAIENLRGVDHSENRKNTDAVNRNYSIQGAKNLRAVIRQGFARYE